MRRILFAVLVSAAAVAVVPASSVASGHSRGEHHRREHGREHGRHHRRHHGVRHVQLGHDSGAPNSGTAGMIKLFSGGVLTITLNDGPDVSGTVNDFTRIKCETPEPMEMTTNDRGPDGGGDQGGSGDHGDHGDQGDQGDDNGNQGEPGDDHGDDNGQMCTTAALTPGAVVQDAELRISGAGSVWDEVELAHQQ